MAGMISLSLQVDSDEPDSETEAHFDPTREGRYPLLSGFGGPYEGNANYLCAICGLVLAECLRPYLKSNAVLDCPSCGARNRFPEEWS